MQANGSPQRTKRAPKQDAASKPRTTPRRTDSQKTKEPREGSTMWAAIQMLRGRREPMTPAAIYAEIKKRKLAPGLKGKTPEQTVAAALAVAAKRGKHVERAAPGKFRLAKEARS